MDDTPDNPRRDAAKTAPAAFDFVALADFVCSVGHNEFLGLKYQRHGTDWVEMVLPWRADLIGVEETGVLASGPIVSLLDHCTSMSVWARRAMFVAHVTLDLRIDYVRAAGPERTVTARCECYQVRRSMAFVRGVAHDGDPTDPVAHAAGIFMLVDSEQAPRE